MKPYFQSKVTYLPAHTCLAYRKVVQLIIFTFDSRRIGAEYLTQNRGLFSMEFSTIIPYSVQHFLLYSRMATANSTLFLLR